MQMCIRDSYRIVKDKKIADVEMTGMWETALSKIEAGNMDADTFRKGIEAVSYTHLRP